MTLRTLFAIPVLFVLLMGMASCPTRLKTDPIMSAMAANDLTAMVEGCGNQLVAGYTFCRKVEGSATEEAINLVAPAAVCQGDKPCVEWKVYYPDGSGPVGGTFPKGQTRVSVKWKDLLHRDTFELGDGGFWGLRYIVTWVNEQGYEKKTVLDGEIRLIVNRKGYQSLAEVQNDAAFAWTWKENGVDAKMTTGGRAYVGAAQ